MMFYSCEKDSVKSLQVENLKNDSRFIAVAKDNQRLIENVTDSKSAIALIRKKNPTAADLDKLSLMLGFNKFQEYSNFVDAQDKVLLQIKKEYNLGRVTQNELINIAKEALKAPSYNAKYGSQNKVSVAEDNCERIRRNCLIEVAAIATAAHLACVSADLTVVLGAICHGAAIAYQAAAGDTCNAEAEDCVSSIAIASLK